MTEGKTFKRRVRERMSKTGESYTSARAQVVQKRDRTRSAEARLAAEATEDRQPDEAVRRATRKTWEEWFSILDSWGARERKHRDIAKHLREEHGVPSWWSQSVTVEYERTRGMRLKHQQDDGFGISATKTIAVPVEVAYEAFVDDVKRKEWLPDASMSLRTSQPSRTARFDWEDGSTRVVVGFIDKGPERSTVALAHERLPDAEEAETKKAMWRRRLAELKAQLESWAAR